MSMYLLKDAVAPVGFGVVVIALLFIMKGWLNFVIGIPIYIIGIALVALIIPTITLFTIVMSFYRYGPEGFVAMECRREGKDAILNTEIGTGVTEFLVGTKRDPKDPIYSDDQGGVKVDPSLVSQYSEPLRLSGGLNVFGWAHHSMFPQTTRNHLAFKGIVEYFDDIELAVKLCENPSPEELSVASLDFLTINERVELIMKPEHFLEEDLKTKVGKYFKQRVEKDTKEVVYFRQFEKEGKWYEQTVNVPQLRHAIQRVKSDLQKRPIPWGYYCMTEAFKYNNVPYTAQHLSSLKMLLQQLRDEYWMKMLNWMQYGMIICGILGLTILGIYVLGSTVFKG
jgi:hypothetical protein